MELNTFTVTDDAENGVWVDMGNDARIKVARMNNKKYKRSIKTLSTPYKRMIQMNALPDDTAEQILNKAMAEAILLDWEGLKLNGEELPYNRDNAMKILSDPALEDFRNVVMDISNDMELFREQEQEEEIKN